MATIPYAISVFEYFITERTVSWHNTVQLSGLTMDLCHQYIIFWIQDGNAKSTVLSMVESNQVDTEHAKRSRDRDYCLHWLPTIESPARAELQSKSLIKWFNTPSQTFRAEEAIAHMRIAER